MDKIAISYRQACMRLAIYGFSNRQVIAAMDHCPAAGAFDGSQFYYCDDVDAAADALLDQLQLDDCGGE
jgi:hypothetical protein